MTNLLIKILMKGNNERTKYGNMAGLVGIFCNVTLFVGKFLTGFLFGSMAIAADAFNNLSDAASNIVSLVGFKLASKEADEKHPYGHARYEYLAGLGVCVIIVAIGINLLMEGVKKIIHPEMLEFNKVTVIVLLFSIVVKLWMSFFNDKVAGIIDSDTLRATAQDSRNDCIATFGVLVSTIATYMTNIAVIDGIVAVVVSVFIIYSGFSLMRESLDRLLGESPDEELVKKIENKVNSYESVLGFHDLMVHDYGPGRQFASIHIELPAEMDSLIAHDIIDNIESDFLMNDKIQIVAHYDPIVTSDEKVGEIRKYISKNVKEYDERLSIHDLRVVYGPTHTNIIFDLVLPAEFKKDKEELVRYIRDKVKQLNDTYECVIKLEQSYIAVMK